MYVYITCTLDVARAKFYAVHDILCFNFFRRFSCIALRIVHIARTDRYFSETKHRYIDKCMCHYEHYIIMWYFVTRKARRALQIFSLMKEKERIIFVT